MSYQSEYRVWELSKQKGSHLLVLVRLANQANDAGIAWPARSKLATTCRMTTRRIEQIANEIANAGEMAILKGGLGRGDTNNYIILVGLSEDKAQRVMALTREYNARMGEKISPISGGKGEISDEERAKLLARKGEILRILESLLLEHERPRKKDHAAAPHDARPPDLHFEALADVTDLTPPERNWKNLTKTAAGQLNRYAKELRDAGAMPEQIAAFGPWWYANDWRGQKHQAPKPADVSREWPRYMNGGTNGSHRQGAQLSDAERERLKRVTDAINAKRAEKRAAQQGAS